MSVHDNKVAIITGGAQGIGRGVVDVLASEGAKVCIADISEEHGKEAVETIKQSGGSAMFVKADFQKSEVPKMVVDECISEFGRIDYLIIPIASVQGLQSMKLVPAYAASKGGVLSLTRNMALDYAKEQIRVMAICPGAFNTPLLRNSMAGDIEEGFKAMGDAHPIGRIGQPDEIGNAASFLCSDKASFITGEYLVIDGGMMAWGAWDTGDQGE